MELFSKYGEINSVKVMWPRTEEEKIRKRNCGFVSYRLRSDAEEALVSKQQIVSICSYNFVNINYYLISFYVCISWSCKTMIWMVIK